MTQTKAAARDGGDCVEGIEAAKAAGKHTGRPPFGFDVNEGYLTRRQAEAPERLREQLPHNQNRHTPQ